MFIYDDDDIIMNAQESAMDDALEGIGSYNNTKAGVWYSTGGQLWGKEANKHLEALQEIQARGLSEGKQVQAIVEYEKKHKVSFTRREMQAAGIVGAVIGAVLTIPIGGFGAYIGADIGSKIAHKKELERAISNESAMDDALEGIGSYNDTNAGVWYSTGGPLWGKEANKHLEALQEIQSKGLSEEKQVQAIVEYERKNKVSFTRRELQAAGIAGAVIGAVLTIPIGGLGAFIGADIGSKIAHKKELKKELRRDAQESAIEEALETLLSE